MSTDRPEIQTHGDTIDSTAKIHEEAVASLRRKEDKAILTSQAATPDKASDLLPSLSIGDGKPEPATAGDSQKTSAASDNLVSDAALQASLPEANAQPPYAKLEAKTTDKSKTLLPKVEISDRESKESITSSQTDMKMDQSTKEKIIDNLVKNLDQKYIFPDVAKNAEVYIKQQEAQGKYSSITSPEEFADRLTQDVRSVTHDLHFLVTYSSKAVPDANLDNLSDQEKQAMKDRMKSIDSAQNFGIGESKILDGNIGYLDLKYFSPPEDSKDAVAKVMSSLADSKALIIDLRHNTGGDPQGVAQILSYFMNPGTHLNDLVYRDNSVSSTYTSTPQGKSFGTEKPVYILTSDATISGGEEFSNDAKTLKRATIVGQTTAGGANPATGAKLDDHFIASIPLAYARNSITGTNWEDKGVSPDISVPANDALKVAITLARS